MLLFEILDFPTLSYTSTREISTIPTWSLRKVTFSGRSLLEKAIILIIVRPPRIIMYLLQYNRVKNLTTPF